MEFGEWGISLRRLSLLGAHPSNSLSGLGGEAPRRGYDLATPDFAGNEDGSAEDRTGVKNSGERNRCKDLTMMAIALREELRRVKKDATS